MKRLVIMLMGILLLHSMASAQDDKFKALFVYNFTKKMEWPKNRQIGDFIIGVVGNSPIINELKAFTHNKTVGAQAIVIEEILTSGEYAKYNIIYVPAKASSQVETIKEQVKGKGVLVVTDKQGLAHTMSDINFVKIDGQQKFEINANHLKEQGLIATRDLLSLGIPVE